MVTEYVSFNRPTVVAIKMTEGPYMFISFVGSWRFKAIDEARAEVTFLYAFELRFPFNLLKRFVKGNLQANVRQRLLDLKKCMEKRKMNV
jgi:hypothetical protein